jgi:hypothetical protein
VWPHVVISSVANHNRLWPKLLIFDYSDTLLEHGISVFTLDRDFSRIAPSPAWYSTVSDVDSAEMGVLRHHLCVRPSAARASPADSGTVEAALSRYRAGPSFPTLLATDSSAMF